MLVAQLLSASLSKDAEATIAIHSMTLHVNGQAREFPDSLTLAALVAELGMKTDRVAAELNLEIVPRASWESTVLKDGDRLEIVHFVGGGAEKISNKHLAIGN